MTNKYKRPDFIHSSGNIILTNRTLYMPVDKLYTVYKAGKLVTEIYLPKNKIIEKNKVYPTLFIYGCKYVLIEGENKHDLRRFLEYINLKNVSPENRLEQKLDKLIDEILARYKSVKGLSTLRYVFFGADSNARIEKILRSELDIFDQVYMAEKITKYKLRISTAETNKLRSDNTLNKLYSHYYVGCTKKQLKHISGLSISTIKRYWHRIINYSPVKEISDKKQEEIIVHGEIKQFADDEELPSSFLESVIMEIGLEKIPEYEFY